MTKCQVQLWSFVQETIVHHSLIDIWNSTQTFKSWTTEKCRCIIFNTTHPKCNRCACQAGRVGISCRGWRTCIRSKAESAAIRVGDHLERLNISILFIMPLATSDLSLTSGICNHNTYSEWSALQKDLWIPKQNHMVFGVHIFRVSLDHHGIHNNGLGVQNNIVVQNRIGGKHHVILENRQLVLGVARQLGLVFLSDAVTRIARNHPTCSMVNDPSFRI